MSGTVDTTHPLEAIGALQSTVERNSTVRESMRTELEGLRTAVSDLWTQQSRVFLALKIGGQALLSHTQQDGGADNMSQ